LWTHLQIPRACKSNQLHTDETTNINVTLWAQFMSIIKPNEQKIGHWLTNDVKDRMLQSANFFKALGLCSKNKLFWFLRISEWLCHNEDATFQQMTFCCSLVQLLWLSQKLKERICFARFEILLIAKCNMIHSLLLFMSTMAASMIEFDKKENWTVFLHQFNPAVMVSNNQPCQLFDCEQQQKTQTLSLPPWSHPISYFLSLVFDSFPFKHIGLGGSLHTLLVRKTIGKQNLDKLTSVQHQQC